MITDRLTLTKALERAGIAREGAEHVADVISGAIRDKGATKGPASRQSTAPDASDRPVPFFGGAEEMPPGLGVA
jgi:hypothetical protein